MRIHAIELRNFRGVSERTVEFATDGVTIVEGPNEIGKTSIAEAIDLVIEDLDSTSKQRVQVVKPVDRDVGPEIMIEVETGPYVFRYHKRFLRDKVTELEITELEITKPKPEHYTGREAHERVLAILAETVDMALWRALRMQQGDVIGQARLEDQTSLSAALDRSAGESPAGDDEMTLFGRAHAEYLEYWTETGRRKQDVIAMERTIDSTKVEIAGVEESIRAIDADVDASVRLEADARRLAERGTEHRATVDQYQVRVEALAKLETGVETTEARFESARLSASEARRVSKARQDAVVAIAEGVAAHGVLDALARDDSPELDSAHARVVAADLAVADARAARDAASARVDAGQQRLAHLRDVADLSSLTERSGRAQTALAAIQAATPNAAIPVDASALEVIRSQHRTVELARARLDAMRPLVHVRALADLVGVIDGLAVQVPAGSSLDRRVDRTIELRLPDVATLSVKVGGAGDLTNAELQAAEDLLATRLREAGASDLADAERLHRAREEATRTIADQKRILNDSLRNLTPEALAVQVAMLRGRVADAAVPEGVDNPEAAGRAAQDAQRAFSTTDQAVRAAEQEWQAAHTRLSEMDLARAERSTTLRLAAEEIGRRELALAEERQGASDESLAARLLTCEAAEAVLTVEFDSARRALTQEGPTQARELLDNAKHALERVETDTRKVEDELLEVKTRLLDHGEDGLAEDLQEANDRLERTELELRRYQGHAASRRLLYETLRTEREVARRSYVMPLRREIVSLGKIVFGPDFEVELDDQDLTVVNRTLHGRTIPFNSLSVGAREQIALISRLACATIVAPDGGVPVILDDALGNSDPQRLATMGAALAVAGRQSQIIILTCQPDRYVHVGSARTVRLL